jgi:hypothetical protein
MDILRAEASIQVDTELCSSTSFSSLLAVLQEHAVDELNMQDSESIMHKSYAIIATRVATARDTLHRDMNDGIRRSHKSTDLSRRLDIQA